MKLKINSEMREVESASNIQELLEHLDVKSQNGVAVALNYSVIPKEQWKSHSLNEQDEITILQAVQGG